MKFILKILLAPVMLIVWLFECVCKLALKLSSVVFVLASILFAAASIFYFTHGSVLNGCIGLVIAFLLSPYGLPMLAVKLLAWFIAVIRSFSSEAERKRKARQKLRLDE